MHTSFLHMIDLLTDYPHMSRMYCSFDSSARCPASHQFPVPVVPTLPLYNTHIHLLRNVRCKLTCNCLQLTVSYYCVCSAMQMRSPVGVGIENTSYFYVVAKFAMVHAPCFAIRAAVHSACKNPRACTARSEESFHRFLQTQSVLDKSGLTTAEEKLSNVNGPL